MIPTKDNRLTLNCPHCGWLHAVIYGPSMENPDGTVASQMKLKNMTKLELKAHEAKHCYDNKCINCGKALT